MLGYDPIQAGLCLPADDAVDLLRHDASRRGCVARFSARAVITAGMLLATLGIALLSGVAPGGSYIANVLPGALLSATGMGLSLVPATIVAMQGLAGSQSGIGSGLLNTSRLMGGALGLAVLSTIADAQTRASAARGSAAALTSGFDLAFVVGAGLSLLGAVLAVLLLRSRADSALDRRRGAVRGLETV